MFIGSDCNQKDVRILRFDSTCFEVFGLSSNSTAISNSIANMNYGSVSNVASWSQVIPLSFLIPDMQAFKNGRNITKAPKLNNLVLDVICQAALHIVNLDCILTGIKIHAIHIQMFLINFLFPT
jgi:hypothetical protein